MSGWRHTLRELDLDRYKCVSFDVFDTLVNRDVKEPKDIFRICEWEYPRRYHTDGISGYTELRIKCEKDARMKQDQEVTHDQIFQEMERYSDKETVDEYKGLEIQAEIDFSTANRRGRQLYEKALRSGKRIVLTTDMYLPRQVIEKILRKNGYSGYRALYLSSESGRTKSKGDIYDHILERENVSPDEFIHIGDNWKSDVLNARLKKIHTYYLRRSEENRKYRASGGSADERLISNALTAFFQNRREAYDASEETRVGYTCLGPLLYGFLDWLDAKCADDGVESILFFSRDGFLMQRIYEKMERRCTAKSSYFYASRRALQVAALCLASTYEEAIHAMNFPRRVTLAWLVNSWGLDASLYRKEIESLRLSPELEYGRDDLPGNPKLRELFDLLKADITANSRRECRAFLQYLREMGCHGKTAIVDIGWNGNMQRAFEKIARHFDLDLTVRGYYLGIVPDSPNQLEQDMRGYLFQKGKNEELFLKVRYINCMLEMFLTAPHGSLKRYRISATGKVETEQEEFEYQGLPLYSDIMALQGAAQAFVHDFTGVGRHICNNEWSYSEPLRKHFLCPTIQTVRYWGNFRMWDGNWVSLVRCKRLRERWKYFIHPQEFLADFLQSSWKIGFLKQIFGLRLPYADILIWMRKIHDRKNNM